MNVSPAFRSKSKGEMLLFAAITQLVHHFIALWSVKNVCSFLSPRLAIASLFCHNLHFLQLTQKAIADHWESRMSFQEIQRGAKRPAGRTQSPSQAVGSGIFQINTAVTAFRRLVDAIGTVKDTPEHRQKLYVLVHSLWNEQNFSFIWFFRRDFACYLTAMVGFAYYLVGIMRGSGYCSWWRILRLSSRRWANLIVLPIPMCDSLCLSAVCYFS